MICEYCGKEHDGTFGSGRFCSKYCSIAFSNTNRKVSEETKRKISNSLAKHKKIRYCKFCGKILNNKKSKSKFCCNEHKIINRILQTLIKYFGFNIELLGTSEALSEYNRIKQMLYDLYWVKHKSSSEIARMFNYPNIGNITGKLFKYLGICSKSCKESAKENFKYKRSCIPTTKRNNYKSGWHKTWDGKNVFLRSSYEFNYANYLDSNKIFYDVESLRIEYYDTQLCCTRISIPDFYLQSTNTIVEIKSNYTLNLNLQNMKDKIKSYKEHGYNFILIVDGIISDINNL